ncbi:MAG: polymer-forming cytoskeletal protein [Gammaproteobacteria bacterium]|nr:polymer-forming cytoskeletal protein [Gammaproteobacteria bacterium]
MLGNSKKRNPRMDTLVGPNTKVTGDINFEGGLHVDGVINGNVIALEPDSKISVSQHGRIEGEVKVPVIALDGTVVGDVYSGERIELGIHARVTGNVYYNLIEMASGAAVNGKLVHKPAGQPLLALKHDDKKAEKQPENASEKQAAGSS